MDLRFICGLFEGSKAVTPFSLEACVRDPKSSGSFSDTFVIFKVQPLCLFPWSKLHNFITFKKFYLTFFGIFPTLYQLMMVLRKRPLHFHVIRVVMYVDFIGLNSILSC